MTNQQKGLVLVGLFVAWGGLTAYQMSDFSESSSSDLSSTLQQANSTLPTVKALLLDQSFPNARQMATFSQPRNIFAPLGLRKVVARQKDSDHPASFPTNHGTPFSSTTRPLSFRPGRTTSTATAQPIPVSGVSD